MAHVWGYKPAKNVLSTENLGRASEALRAGPVFGYTYRPHSGSGPWEWIATTFAEYQLLFADGRRADYTVAWSLPALLEQGMALAVARYADLPAGMTSLFTPAEMVAIAAHFLDPPDPLREVWMLFFGTSASHWTDNRPVDHDGLGEIAENAEWYCKPGGEGYLFPFNSSQRRDADGLLPHTIERPEYWLLDGWYPDELGRVPTEIGFG